MIVRMKMAAMVKISFFMVIDSIGSLMCACVGCLGLWCWNDVIEPFGMGDTLEWEWGVLKMGV